MDSAWQVIESARKWVEQELEKWAGAAKEKGISVRTFVRTGSPYQGIVESTSRRTSARTLW